ncbi:putative reverse transcriptase domain-containing protein [Tanacetum coccineum]
MTGDCRNPAVARNQRTLTFYECGNPGHYRSDCPELKNQNHGNQAEGTGARGLVHVLGGGEADQDPNDMEDNINYRELNKLMVKNRYPLQRIDDLFDQLQGSSVYSNKPAIWVYHPNFEYVEEDIPIYQRRHSEPNKKEHEEHLKAILELLKKEELYAKFSKCEFWIPKTPMEIRQFLGLVLVFNRRFIEGFQKSVSLRTKLTRKGQVDWGTNKKQQALSILKAKLCSTPILALSEGKRRF